MLNIWCQYAKSMEMWIYGAENPNFKPQWLKQTQQGETVLNSVACSDQVNTGNTGNAKITWLE